MAHYKAANSKHEPFWRYLEKSEPEKPNSALDFLKHHLGAATPENPEIELLHLELVKMKEKYKATVKKKKKKLKAQLAQYEPPQEEKRAE
uniref:Uncharacterized protein n=1 Tax=Macaca nemestrina TaxID=9545 RepID=A0A2K6BYW9_MACNE